MKWKQGSNLRTTDFSGAVKPSNFILLFTDLEVPIQAILKVIICLCKPDGEMANVDAGKKFDRYFDEICGCRQEKWYRNIENISALSDDEES